MTDTANNAPNPNKARDRVADRERAARALDLRRDGHTWRAIADKVGYHDAGTAYTAVSRLLARVESEAAGEYREIASQRYEQLWREVVTALDNLEPGREVAAAQLITTGRHILDALVRLHGLNAEQAITPAVKVTDDLADELSRLTAAMQAAGKGTTECSSGPPSGNSRGSTPRTQPDESTTPSVRPGRDPRRPAGATPLFDRQRRHVPAMLEAIDQLRLLWRVSPLNDCAGRVVR